MIPPGGSTTGSSPLARGTRAALPDPPLDTRFIPTGAGNTPAPPPCAPASSVHPRWRGEHPFDGGVQVAHDGSSPLARGTRSAGLCGDAHGRFIPAGAGNTVRYVEWDELPPVHPRWRGEHSTAARVSALRRGSSPLARGTLPGFGAFLAVPRFIPAGAGNTSRELCDMTILPVHPRWRGEHRPIQSRSRLTHGSSPLARGTPNLERQAVLFVRFIPAGAGNTSGIHWVLISMPVHPRWRGEHVGDPLGVDLDAGSSPLARGTLSFPNAAESAARFIPAGAGNTEGHAALGAPHAVHPRWRGEHHPHTFSPLCLPGSSPLARGTRSLSNCGCGLLRFIPAGAGNTIVQSTPGMQESVHPRWRGEHRPRSLWYSSVIGSSPLARGTPIELDLHHVLMRFIPAGAGNTSSSPAWIMAWAGSSPLARGTQHQAAETGFVIRFIPAGAGNTRQAHDRPRRLPVHPRWRGEHTKPNSA